MIEVPRLQHSLGHGTGHGIADDVDQFAETQPETRWGAAADGGPGDGLFIRVERYEYDWDAVGRAVNVDDPGGFARCRVPRVGVFVTFDDDRAIP